MGRFTEENESAGWVEISFLGLKKERRYSNLQTT